MYATAGFSFGTPLFFFRLLSSSSFSSFFSSFLLNSSLLSHSNQPSHPAPLSSSSLHNEVPCCRRCCCHCCRRQRSADSNQVGEHPLSFFVVSPEFTPNYTTIPYTDSSYCSSLIVTLPREPFGTLAARVTSPGPATVLRKATTPRPRPFSLSTDLRLPCASSLTWEPWTAPELPFRLLFPSLPPLSLEPTLSACRRAPNHRTAHPSRLSTQRRRPPQPLPVLLPLGTPPPPAQAQEMPSSLAPWSLFSDVPSLLSNTFFKEHPSLVKGQKLKNECGQVIRSD